MTADELRRVKLRLWESVVGAEMSPEVACALYYVDVSKRIATLIGSGWVRDEGSALYASGAEPHVVAVMVAAAQAKGWSAVRIWGDADFLAEARRQFEAAGIPVTTAGEPVRAPQPDFNVHLREEVVDHFRNGKKAAEERMRLLSSPIQDSAMLQRARKKCDDARLNWVISHKKAFQAQKELELLQTILDDTSIFRRRKAATNRDAAQKIFDDLQKDASRLQDELRSSENFLMTLQSIHEKRRRRQANENNDELHRLARDCAIASLCLEMISSDPSLALIGTEELTRAMSSQLDNNAPSTAEQEIAVSLSGPTL